MKESPHAYALAKNEGEGFWFLNNLMTVKAGGDATRNAFTLIESLGPAGFGPPRHIHEVEDEGFYVLEGNVTVTCGDESWEATPGSFVFLPRGIPHMYIIGKSPARMLQITSPAQFERFIEEVGEPAKTQTLPPPKEPDVPKLLAASKKFRFELLPPG